MARIFIVVLLSLSSLLISDLALGWTAVLHLLLVVTIELKDSFDSMVA